MKAATAFPAGYLPQVPINDKKMYPFSAKCVELDIPMVINAGVPGPRLPMACQDVALLDEGCASTSPSCVWSRATVASRGPTWP